MEVELVYCGVRCEAEFNINLNDLDKHYASEIWLNYKDERNICTKEDGKLYPISISIEEYTMRTNTQYEYRSAIGSDSDASRFFGIQMGRVSDIKCEADLEVTFTTTSEKITLNEWKLEKNLNNWPYTCSIKCHMPIANGRQFHKIKAVRGKMTLSFVPLENS